MRFVRLLPTCLLSGCLLGWNPTTEVEDSSVCGDNRVEGIEVCDGTDLAGENCETQGFYGGQLTCSSCSFVTDECTNCGDGDVDEVDGEDCDDGVNDAVYGEEGGCAPGCVSARYCGDGTPDLSEGEDCDDGRNDGAYGGCEGDCTLAPYCGDAIVDDVHGEECDDGVNDGSYDGCEPNCTVAAFCGDAAVDTDGGEECDDGTNDGTMSACSSGCACGWQLSDAALAEILVFGVAPHPSAGGFATGSARGPLAPSEGLDRDAFVSRFDDDGGLLWTHQWGTEVADGGLAVTSDSDGSVYVAGYTAAGLDGNVSAGETDIFVSKLDESGAVAWTTQLGSAATDVARAIAVEDAGRVFVGGYTSGALDGISSPTSVDWDGFVVALEADGGVAWTHQFGVADDPVSVAGLALLADGSVAAVGYVGGSGALEGATSAEGGDAFLVVLSRDGVVTRTEQFGSSGAESATAVVEAADGSLLVLGSTNGDLHGETSSGGWDLFVTKFGASSREWTRLAGTPMDERSAGMALGDAGEIYVTGTTTGSWGQTIADVHTDLVLAALTSDGELDWIRQVGGLEVDEGRDVAVTVAGEVVVGGFQRTPNNQQPQRGDGLLVAFNAQGDEQWTRALAAATDRGAWGMALDEQGILVAEDVTSYAPGEYSAGAYDAVLSLYSLGGERVWSTQHGTLENDSGSAVVVGTNTYFLVGYTSGPMDGQPVLGGGDVFVAAHDLQGRSTWTKLFGTSSSDYAAGAVPDGVGGAYLAGTTSGSWGTPLGGVDGFVLRMDPSGGETWVSQFGTAQSDEAYAIASVDAGGVVVTGGTRGDLAAPSAGGTDVFLTRFDESGGQVWARQFGTTAEDVAYGVTVDSSGNVAVVGGTSASLDFQQAFGNVDGFISVFDADGTKLWTRQFGTSSEDRAIATAADDSGFLILGYTRGEMAAGEALGGRDVFLTHYSTAGAHEWTMQLGTPLDDFAAALHSDGLGGAYVSAASDREDAEGEALGTVSSLWRICPPGG